MTATLREPTIEIRAVPVDYGIPRDLFFLVDLIEPDGERHPWWNGWSYQDAIYAAEVLSRRSDRPVHDLVGGN